MEKGIYTLANDVVYDQLVALLNSVEKNYSSQIPVCIIPYDDNISKIETEIKKRKNCNIFSDVTSIERWEEFAKKVWQLHPTAKKEWQKRSILGVNRLGMHRRMCAFDGPFEKFVFLDSDTLIMNSLEFIFKKLDQYCLVGYDYQYKDPSHVYNMKSKKVYQVFSKNRIDSEIFCAGFFASKRSTFDNKSKNSILAYLQTGEAEILYINGPDQSLLNYMIMRSNKPVYNFGIDLPYKERTGNSVTSTHFEEKSHILYDKNKRLTYLHYIGIPSYIIKKVCHGENLYFPYRDTFLHYRYLYEKEKCPKFYDMPRSHNRQPSFIKRLYKKLKFKR